MIRSRDVVFEEKIIHNKSVAIPVPIDLHEQILQRSNAEIEGKSENSSRSNE